MPSSDVTTVIEQLLRSLSEAARHNPSDVDAPVAILWTDHEGQWLPVIPRLRQLVPQLLTLGEYQPEQRKGPAVWLRTVVDRALPEIEIPEGVVPILYLPDVSRQELRTAQECPDVLKPLVELQYRGVSWTQKNGKDWTVEAFLVSEEGGLGLDVARDAATRRSMLAALSELATMPVAQLKGKRLEAEDFDRLFSDDTVSDLLLWLSNPQAIKGEWKGGRWTAFRSRCKAEYGFDPDKDGELVGAELLGRQKGSWGNVWLRFAESPSLYPDVPELLRKAKPQKLLEDASSTWPQNNKRAEDDLRQALLALESTTLANARECVLELEKLHGPRREWVWAKLRLAPLAKAIGHLARLVKLTENRLGGASPVEMAKLYTGGAWETDAAALSAVAAVKSTADTQAVGKALNAIYRPWLESAAEHFQALVGEEPLPGPSDQSVDELIAEAGGIILFVDGLRFDVSQRVVSRARKKGWLANLSTRWAGLPTVTATAKPAVSPVTKQIKGADLGENFLPLVKGDEKPLTTDRFRKLLASAGYQYIGEDETGDPAGRGWTESGQLDKLGHSLQVNLAQRIEDQMEMLIERIDTLFAVGWREVRIVTDHGWLWLPGGLPKVDLPKCLTASRWARCASIKGNSTVDVPTVYWYWNAQERVAVAPSIACFGAGNEYAHGGVSLQECLVPVIRLTPGEDATKAVVEIDTVSWVGLRCRVHVKAIRSELRVDLRIKVNDPDSSLDQARSPDEKGMVSFLIEPDDLGGVTAVVVVLDAHGHVVAKQPTIIGGDK
jgi:hypothetical protein